MKRFIFKFTFIVGKISLLIATFLIGAASTSLWLEFFPPTVTLCEIAKNPKLYEGRKVKLDTLANAYGGMISFEDSACNSAASNAGIRLPEDYKSTSQDVQDFLSETNHNFLSARVLITGRIDSEVIMGCRWSKFRIQATDFQLTSAVIVEPKEEQNESNF